MINIAITGCAGFIGSHLIELLDERYSIIGIDNFSFAGSKQNILPSIPIYNCDINDYSYLHSILTKHKVEWVINCAAETHVDRSIDSNHPFIRSNVTGVQTLIDLCLSLDTNLLHFSTDEVYGSTLDGCFDEDAAMQPTNPYSATKAAAEHLLDAYKHTAALKCITVRPSNNFGPKQDGEKFLPTIINNILNKSKIPLYGNGTNIRTWTYVKNTCNAIEFLIKHGEMGDTYNISDDAEITNLAMIEIVAEAMGVPAAEAYKFVPDRKGHDFRYSVDATKLSKMGYAPEHPFKDAIIKTIEHYKECA